MKKVFATVCFASLMASTTVFALSYNGTNTPGEGVVVSKHNMLRYTENESSESQGRVCAFCHTPHHALPGTAVADYMPLWSHALPTESYNAYNSPTVNVTVGNPLKGATILCMSCHDGVVAVDQHYGSTTNKSVTTEFNWLGAAVGKHDGADKIDLRNDHPIGFSYAEAQKNHPGDLNDITQVWPGAGKKTSGTKTIKDVLTNGDFFTCASCHDVHNKDNVVNSVNSGVNYFLYADQKDSAFCLVCHKK